MSKGSTGSMLTRSVGVPAARYERARSCSLAGPHGAKQHVDLWFAHWQAPLWHPLWQLA